MAPRQFQHHLKLGKKTNLKFIKKKVIPLKEIVFLARKKCKKNSS